MDNTLFTKHSSTPYHFCQKKPFMITWETSGQHLLSLDESTLIRLITNFHMTLSFYPFLCTGPQMYSPLIMQAC